MKKDGEFSESNDFCSEDYSTESNSGIPPSEIEDDHCCCCCGCCASESETEEQFTASKGIPVVQPNLPKDPLQNVLQSESEISERKINRNDLMIALANCGIYSGEKADGCASGETNLNTMVTPDEGFFTDDPLGSEIARSSSRDSRSSNESRCEMCENKGESACLNEERCSFKDCPECRVTKRKSRKSKTASRRSRRRQRNKPCQCAQCFCPDSDLSEGNSARDGKLLKSERTLTLAETYSSETAMNNLNGESADNSAMDIGENKRLLTSDSDSQSSCCELCAQEGLLNSATDDDCNCFDCEKARLPRSNNDGKEKELLEKQSNNASNSLDNLLGISNDASNRNVSEERCDQCDQHDMCPCEQCQPQNPPDGDSCEVCGFRASNTSEKFGDKDFFF